MQGMQVQLLVGKLRSHMPLGQKNWNIKPKQYFNKVNKDFKSGPHQKHLFLKKHIISFLSINRFSLNLSFKAFLQIVLPLTLSSLPNSHPHIYEKLPRVFSLWKGTGAHLRPSLTKWLFASPHALFSLPEGSFPPNHNSCIMFLRNLTPNLPLPWGFFSYQSHLILNLWSHCSY